MISNKSLKAVNQQNRCPKKKDKGKKHWSTKTP